MTTRIQVRGPDKADVMTLAGTDAPAVVSIYHPTLRSTFMPTQNRDRLKALSQEARRALIGRGWKRAEADDLLAPVDDLIESETVWRHPMDGIAVFVWAGGFRWFPLSFAVPERVAVGTAPLVTPLLPCLTHRDFYILALSQKHVRLYRGDEGALIELSLGAFPRSLSEDLRSDDVERHLSSHATSRATSSTGARAARGGKHVWHGQPGGSEPNKDRVRHFMKTVDEGVGEVLRGAGAPLILAGVAYEQDLYRSVSTRTHPIEEGIRGNPDLIDPHRMHREALALVDARGAELVRRELERYGAEAAAGRASSDVWTIAEAVGAGRAETLIVERDAGAGSGHDGTERDLIDDLVRVALLRGVTVHLSGHDLLPAGSGIVGLFRY